jgi:hypothetical protein
LLRRISEEELQRHLVAGLPDLAAPELAGRLGAPARRPSATPGDAIRALRIS